MYNWDGIDFSRGADPVKVQKVFEKNNPGITLLITYVEEDTGEIVKFPPSRDYSRPKRADILFFMDEDGNEHFAAVKNRTRLSRAQMVRNVGNSLFFCDFCDNCFTTEPQKIKHEGMCSKLKPISVSFPEKDEKAGEVQKLKFKHIEFTIRLPTMMVADMEALLLEIDETAGKGTRRYQLHKASACGLYFIREDGDNQYYSFRGGKLCEGVDEKS